MCSRKRHHTPDPRYHQRPIPLQVRRRHRQIRRELRYRHHQRLRGPAPDHLQPVRQLRDRHGRENQQHRGTGRGCVQPRFLALFRIQLRRTESDRNRRHADRPQADHRRGNRIRPESDRRLLFDPDPDRQQNLRGPRPLRPHSGDSRGKARRFRGHNGDHRFPEPRL